MAAGGTPLAHLGGGGGSTLPHTQKLFQYPNCIKRAACVLLVQAAFSTLTLIHVRFAPKSRHEQCTSRCLLWARSGHHLFDHLIRNRHHAGWNTEAERLVILAMRPAVFDHDVLAFNEAFFRETLVECGHKVRNTLRP